MPKKVLNKAQNKDTESSDEEPAKKQIKGKKSVEVEEEEVEDEPVKKTAKKPVKGKKVEVEEEEVEDEPVKKTAKKPVKGKKVEVEEEEVEDEPVKKTVKGKKQVDEEPAKKPVKGKGKKTVEDDEDDDEDKNDDAENEDDSDFDSEKSIFECKTQHVKLIKNVVNLIKEVIEEPTFTIYYKENLSKEKGKNNKYGIKTSALTTDQDILMQLILYQNEFDSFKFNSKLLGKTSYDFCIDVSQLHNHLEMVHDTSDHIKFFISDDKIFSIGAPKINKTKKNGDVDTNTRPKEYNGDLPIIESNRNNLPVSIENEKYNGYVSMSSSEFFNDCKKLNNLNYDYVEIIFNNTGDKTELKLKGKADAYSGSSVITISTTNTKPNKNENIMISGEYPLKSLLTLSRTTFCPEIELYMKSGAPLVIKACIGTLGKLLFYCFPRKNDTN